VLVAWLVLVATPARAEDPLLAWKTHRPIADYLSTALVDVQIGADTWHSWRADHRGRAFANQGCRMGLTLLTTEGAKRLFPRTRPDGSDRKSFWSGHTAQATTAAGWRYEAGIPVAAVVALLRGGSAKHYLSDVGVGALDGALVSWLCHRLIPDVP
jgi:membrane-associated phospholipid phosphatase